MYSEAQCVTLQAVLVSENHLRRHQKKAHKQTQQILGELCCWRDHDGSATEKM